MKFLSVHNIDNEFLESYLNHYARINPWAAFWDSAESGKVLIAEQDCPARMFSHTEFYNEWLRPQKDIEAAVGIKIDGGPKDLFRMPMHYPQSLGRVYDGPAVEVLGRVRGNLARAVNLAQLLRKRSEEAVAGAALVERACCAAFVIDGDRHLRDANQQAVDLFSSGLAAALRHGRVGIAELEADSLFRRAVAALSRGFPTDRSRIHFSNGAGNWQVSLAALPSVSRAETGVSALLPAGPMVLVLVRDLNARRRHSADFSSLSAQFGLTPAEILLCERLAKGDSLAEAAGLLGIAIETARHRSKAIFHKTGTHRQGELVAMLGTFD
ncbi:helix-turn-helix transcriptional regulator [Chelativorans sp. EGI FJ00035]|uniref:Helix-turn-helix transcriptional regulator n=1 Tax=Chelativorans salis TaxID=2978478 RepID=A0ABT2LTM8_9HYPH|nr:helix-turn-helix transcriptional regulator [Chelativorans sp. EGI FJ00035]